MQNPLSKKLQIKDTFSVLILNAPNEVLSEFEGIDFDAVANQQIVYDTIIAFTENKAMLSEWIPKAAAYRQPQKQLWFAYPKKSGSIKTDLNRDSSWEIVAANGFDPVRLISLNDTWSIMKLIDQKERAKESKLGQDPPGVDRKTKTVIPPDDLQTALNAAPDAKAFFESLAFSHKREYVAWILDAKKEETRSRRIDKTVELLLENKKSK